MNQLHKTTSIALGLAGLIPFIAFAYIYLVQDEPSVRVAHWLSYYSFGIISFLTGILWQYSFHAKLPYRLVISNALYLAAFFSLILLPQYWLIAASILLWVIYIIEVFVALYSKDALPTWYLKLRLFLTLVASICLMAVAWMTTYIYQA